jgi:hypothetical protein
MMGMMLRDSVRVKLQGDVKGGVFFIYKKFPVELNRSVSPKSLNPMRNLNISLTQAACNEYSIESTEVIF